MVKNKRMKMFVSSLFIVICLCSCAHNNNTTTKEWEENEELTRIIEKAEIYLAEKQAKILTLSDLEYTYWVPEGGNEKRIIEWDFLFLNENLVLIFDYYASVGVVIPHSLIHYSIQDNIMYFTEYMTGYLDNTYLVIGYEKAGYEKFKLSNTISFWDMEE